MSKQHSNSLTNILVAKNTINAAAMATNKLNEQWLPIAKALNLHSIG